MRRLSITLTKNNNKFYCVGLAANGSSIMPRSQKNGMTPLSVADDRNGLVAQWFAFYLQRWFTRVGRP